MGTTPKVAVTDAEIVKEIMVKEFEKFSDRGFLVSIIATHKTSDPGFMNVQLLLYMRQWPMMTVLITLITGSSQSDSKGTQSTGGYGGVSCGHLETRTTCPHSLILSNGDETGGSQWL